MAKPSNPNRPTSRAEARAAARAKAEELRKAEARRARRRALTMWGGVAVVVIAVAAALGIHAAHHGSNDTATDNTAATDNSTSTLTGPPGPEGIVLEQGNVLAPASDAATGATVSGIQCNSQEQAVYHIHTHVSIYVDGVMRPVPGGVGVVQPQAQQTPQGQFFGASQCYYWLHTHAQDGIIHIEAPSQTTYTLGQFFGVWQQKLSTNQIGSNTGTVTAYVNGKVYNGDPSTIPLKSHEDVQLDLGSPSVAPKKVDWSKAQL